MCYVRKERFTINKVIMNRERQRVERLRWKMIGYPSKEREKIGRNKQIGQINKRGKADYWRKSDTYKIEGTLFPL